MAISVFHLIVLVIVIAALIAICCIAVKAMGIQIPAWAINIFVVICIAVVAIFGIKLILALV